MTRREIPVASELLPFAGRIRGAFNRYSCVFIIYLKKKICNDYVRDDRTELRNNNGATTRVWYSVRDTRRGVLPEKRRALSHTEFNYCVGVFPDRRQGPAQDDGSVGQ